MKRRALGSQDRLSKRGRISARTGDKRENILRVAERLFFERGYDRTSMDEIVSELGVTKPYVYYYFRNKQQILETLSWQPAVEALSSMDFDLDDPRPAHVKVRIGLDRLIRSTLSNHPSGFFTYLEPQAYRPEYKAAEKKLLNRFYDRLCVLLEQGRAEKMLEFDETRITALAACSIPGFVHTWYRPQGRLSADELGSKLTALVCRLIGLKQKRQSRAFRVETLDKKQPPRQQLRLRTKK